MERHSPAVLITLAIDLAIQSYRAERSLAALRKSSGRAVALQKTRTGLIGGSRGRSEKRVDFIQNLRARIRVVDRVAQF